MPAKKKTDVFCGCGAGNSATGRKAVAVDAELKETNSLRLRRIEGQIRGNARMVEEDRYCADIIVQISAVQEALRGVARRLMQNHLKHCVTAGVKSGEKEAESMYEELVELMYKSAR